MSTAPSEPVSKKRELLDALEMARDTARVQAHLFSLEAKQRWQEIESHLSNTEAELERGGERVVESVSRKVDELVNAVKEIVDGISDAFDITAPVSRVMTKDPVTCSPDDRLSRAAQIMWETDCGAVPVVNADGTLVGMITDRDICMATYTRGEPPAALDVRSAMAHTVHCATPNDPIAHVTRMMGRYQVRRVPVIESDRVVGIVALADLARCVRGSESGNIPACVTLAHALAKISERRARSAERIAAE